MTTIRALKIHTDGVVTTIDLAHAEDRGSLDDLYRHIECRSVDVVRLAPNANMWLDDEGAYNAPINEVATALARMYGMNYQPYYYGTAIITGGADEVGETLGLSHDATLMVVAALDVIGQSATESR